MSDSFTCYILRLPPPPRYKGVLTGIGEDLLLAPARGPFCMELRSDMRRARRAKESIVTGIVAEYPDFDWHVYFRQGGCE